MPGQWGVSPESSRAGAAAVFGAKRRARDGIRHWHLGKSGTHASRLTLKWTTFAAIYLMSEFPNWTVKSRGADGPPAPLRTVTEYSPLMLRFAPTKILRFVRLLGTRTQDTGQAGPLISTCAVAKPIPLAPPVTTATRPRPSFRSTFNSLSFCYACKSSHFVRAGILKPHYTAR